MPVPIARWNPARSVWETNETLICGHSDVWSETFPSSGMWAGGQVYELPTSAPLTDGSASSSSPGLLQTPLTTTATGVQQLERQVGGRGSLLPTPRTNDGNGAGAHGTGGPDLRTAVSLLPTPTAQNGEERNQTVWARPPDQPQNLENALAFVLDEEAS